jgi:hypothetical protein
MVFVQYCKVFQHGVFDAVRTNSLAFLFGLHRSISSGVMVSLRVLLKLDQILDTMASCNCGLGGMLVGNTLLKCSTKI